jgi:hypothetical protein
VSEPYWELLGAVGPAGAPGATGQAEGWYSGAGAPGAGVGAVGDWYLDTTPIVTGGGPVTYRKTTPKIVNTTVAATDLLNGEITLAANDLGTNKVLKLAAHGDWKQNSGGNADPPRFQLLLGGTVLLDTGVPTGMAITTTATRFGWWIDATIAEVNGATNQQSVSIRGHVSHGVYNVMAWSAFATGEGSYGVAGTGAGPFMSHLVGWNAGAKDGTTALALALNVINASASANYETALKDALVQIL